MKKETYSELLNKPEWKAKRQQILERDKHNCINCGTNKKLQVHHRQYHYNTASGEMLKPWQYLNRYLITLCDTCHQTGHEQYKVPVKQI